MSINHYSKELISIPIVRSPSETPSEVEKAKLLNCLGHKFFYITNVNNRHLSLLKTYSNTNTFFNFISNIIPLSCIIKPSHILGNNLTISILVTH
jgi:hypothetical protein